MSISALATAATADGNYPSAAGIKPEGRKIILSVRGTWGGATWTTQVSDDGTNWIALSDATFTADGVAEIQVGELLKVRGVISGATGTTSLNSKISDA
jgi:hypothetical protein